MGPANLDDVPEFLRLSFERPVAEIEAPIARVLSNELRTTRSTSRKASLKTMSKVVAEGAGLSNGGGKCHAHDRRIYY
jgi:hypothetical protein